MNEQIDEMITQLFDGNRYKYMDDTVPTFKAKLQRLIVKARISENEQTLYWLEDTELEPDVIVRGLIKDRTARRKRLTKELEKYKQEDK